MFLETNKKIFLASASPRRQELLKNTGIKFEVLKLKNIDENIPENITGEQAALYISEKKAKAYFSEIKENQIIITADTIVCTDDKILGKPENEKEAKEMLEYLSDKYHEVITGVTIFDKTKKKSFCDITEVKFKKLDNDEINYYVKNFKPFDKAGSYGIQEWIGYIGITGIKGSYFNVMGLPVHKVYETLKNDFLNI